MKAMQEFYRVRKQISINKGSEEATFTSNINHFQAAKATGSTLKAIVRAFLVEIIDTNSYKDRQRTKNLHEVSKNFK